MKNLLLCLMLTLPALGLMAQEHLTLEEALEQKLVRIAMKNNGGHMGPMMHIWIKNESDKTLSLKLPEGTQFASGDTTIQDLIVTQPMLLALDPGETEAKDLFTMCTQSYNMSPYRGADYRYNGRAEGALLELVEKIAAGGYQNSTAQSAVWAVVNGYGYEYVYGEDPSMVHDLGETLSEAGGIDISQFNLAPRRHHITYINTSFRTVLPDHLEDASLRLYDPEGNLMWEYFGGRQVERGFVQWNFGVNHHLDSAAELRMELREGEELVAEQAILATDTVAPRYRYHSETILEYDLAEEQRVEIGVFDEAGEMYFLLAEDRVILPGHHRSRYIVGVELPTDQKFFVGIRNEEGWIAQKFLDPEAPEPVRHPKLEVFGMASINLEEVCIGGHIGIYNEAGQLVRKLYDVTRLNPGIREIKYKFSHFDGPDAEFFLRIVDGEGTVRLSKTI